MTLSPDVKKIILQETIGNMVANAVLATAITWLAFSGRTEVPWLGGPDSGAFGIIPGTFLFTAIITIVLSLLMKGRVRNGKVALLPAEALPGLRRLLPQPLVLRAGVLGAVTWIVLVPATLFLLSAILPETAGFTSLLVFYVFYFVVLALVIVPAIVLRSLLPPPRVTT